ncbi:barstar family protein [Streptomyces samsunensis]|uniref:Barstar family protein n=1 Tax=Streptomyces malaysiensis TaxID=92644 RepID=A0ABX6W663_STRMQ|nr:MULTISPECIES: barstar family protein [Streptomyces]MCC4317891.1 barstar family protein [Streptomyces malaysiensis]NUH39382.1 barstar family protein [Streptomyces samsunensis]QPI56254.1 barstar family protein [Streptomyces solisilvae]UHH17732.1 barstar family protein [Streptomyces sp. HNM0561]
MVMERNSWIEIKPWLHLVRPDANVPLRSWLPLPGRTFAAWMNGSDMGSLDGVFQSFWDNFRLPDYFGWNLPALNDCLRDLNWLPADQYFLFIEDAHKILAEDQEELREFLDILDRAGSKWSCAKRSADGAARARFQVVLSCSEEGLEYMQGVTADLR